MSILKFAGIACAFAWSSVALAQGGPWPIPGPWTPPVFGSAPPPRPAMQAGPEKCDPPGTGTAAPAPAAPRFGNCAAVQADLAQTRSDLSKMQGTMEAAKQAIADLRAQLKSAQDSASASQSNTDAMQANLDQLQTRLNAQADKAAVDASAKQSELDAANADIKRLQDALNAAKAAAQLQDEAKAKASTAANADIQKLQDALSAAKAAGQQQADAQSKAAIAAKKQAAKIVSLQTETQKLRAQLQTANTSNQQAQKQNATLQSELDALRKQLADNDVAKADVKAQNTQIATLKAQLVDAQKAQSSAQAKNDRMTSAASEQAAAAQQTADQLVALNGELGKQKAANANAKKLIEELQQNLSSSQDEIVSNLANVKAGNERLNICNKALAGVKNQLQACNNDIASMKAANADDDKDGVINANDQCPTTAEGRLVDTTGCEPDSDADGVSDAADLCPGTPQGMAVQETGCPADQAIALEGVLFVTNSDQLLDESKIILDGVAETLRIHANLNVEVSGHTDSAGNAAYNQDLSQRRANTVREYLANAGIDAGRLSAQGYGEAEPIADNGTADGRSQNRRVELRRLN